MEIENIIDKDLNEVYETLEKYNYFDKENHKTFSDSFSNNDSILSCENYVNKANFTFDQIHSIEKIEDEIWDLEFSFTKTYFATCSRNGIIGIFKLEINNEMQLSELNFEENNKIMKRKNCNNTECLNVTNNNNIVTVDNNNLINIDNINSSLKKKETLFYLNIVCLNNFLSHKKSVTSISWSKNEKFLLSSSVNKEIFLWDPFQGNLIKKFSSHNDIVSSVKWLNNETFVSGSIDKKMRIESIEKGLICAETFSRIRKILISDFYNCIILLPSSLNDIVFYDYKQFREINRLTEMDPIISGNISKKDEGRHLIVNLSKVNASINLYEISNLKLINKFYGHFQEQYSIECTFGGDYDEFIICGSEDANIYIWHISDSIPIRVIKGHTGTINSCNMIKILDKNLIFSASDDHTLRIWGANNINVNFIDKTSNNNTKKKNTISCNRNSGNFSVNNAQNSYVATQNAIFDVVDMSNFRTNNNEISLNNGSREESSDYYIEEDE